MVSAPESRAAIVASADDWLDRFDVRHLKGHELGQLEWDSEYIHFKRQFESVYRDYLLGRAVPWVAVRHEGGLIVGQVFVLLSGRIPGRSTDGRRCAYMYSIRVKPNYRSRGLGSRMMAVAEADLAARGYQTVTLNVARSNQDAQRFYQRHGYQVVAPEPGQWSYLDHTGRRRFVDEPAWRMEKDLV